MIKWTKKKTNCVSVDLNDAFKLFSRIRFTAIWMAQSETKITCCLPIFCIFLFFSFSFAGDDSKFSDQISFFPLILCFTAWLGKHVHCFSGREQSIPFWMSKRFVRKAFFVVVVYQQLQLIGWNGFLIDRFRGILDGLIAF